MPYARSTRPALAMSRRTTSGSWSFRAASAASTCAAIRSAKTAAIRSLRVGNRRYSVALPVPARLAISSSCASRPCSANTARAARTMASRLRAASALSVMATPTDACGEYSPPVTTMCVMTQPARETSTSLDPTPLAGQAQIDALRSSVERLRDLVALLTEEQLARGAYPTEWSIAQVLSHLGSAAVITQRRLEDGLAGQDTPDDFAPGVWDFWNAKEPVAQRDDALAADAALLDRLEALASDDRDGFSSSMGPMTLDFAQFVGMRLNEHAFHTWDIEVVGDAGATLPEHVAALVVDNLDLVARFTGTPTGETITITVETTTPERGFIIDMTPETVTLRTGAPAAAADIRLSAEAFARLVYGRLDAAHTPPGVQDAALETARRVFPGP
jgi:uncharacterized protein (TIGR03083 family)